MGYTVMSKAWKDLIVTKFIEGFYAEKVDGLLKDAMKNVAKAYDEKWSKFDWKHVKPYRDLIVWEDSVFVDGAAWGYRANQKYVDLCQRLGIELKFEVPLSKGYPCKPSCSVYIEPSMRKKIVAAYKPVRVLLDTIVKFVNELDVALASCETVNQIAELFPELVTYFPDSAVELLAPISVGRVNKIRKVLQGSEVKVNAS